MITTVNFEDFRDAFQKIRPENFSYEGQRALFEWLEDYEEQTGEQTELDVIAICCDFSEYESALECAQEHGYEEVVDLEPHGSVDLLEVAKLEEKQAKEWLQDRTTVIDVEGGGVITQQF